MECHRKIQKLSISEEDGLHLVEQWMISLDEDDLCFVSCLARRIWMRRNAIVFGGHLPPPALLVQCTISSLAEYTQASSALKMKLPCHPSLSRWHKPPVGIIKVNWDAALDQSSNSIGVGVIARDEMGWIVASFCTTVPCFTEPTTAEAIAACKAAQFCREQDFQHIIMEGDALMVVEGLMQEGPSWQRYGHLIAEARNFLNGLVSWKISHVHREGNKAAHRLAKLAVHHSLHRVWQGTGPSIILPIVTAEQADF